MNQNLMDDRENQLRKKDNFKKLSELYDLRELAKFNSNLAFYHCIWQEYKNYLVETDIESFSYRKK